MNSTTQIIVFVLSGVLAIGGFLMIHLARSKDRRVNLHVPRVGPLTEVSHGVIGVVLLIVGYHAIVHAGGWSQFRLPWPVVLIGSAVVIAMTVLTDAMEAKSALRQDSNDEQTQ
jgi:hypothetical protein